MCHVGSSHTNSAAIEGMSLVGASRSPFSNEFALVRAPSIEAPGVIGVVCLHPVSTVGRARNICREDHQPSASSEPCPSAPLSLSAIQACFPRGFLTARQDFPPQADSREIYRLAARLLRIMPV